MRKQRQPEILDYTEANEKWAEYCRQKVKEAGGITVSVALPRHCPVCGAMTNGLFCGGSCARKYQEVKT